MFSSSFKFLGIQDELKARPPYRVDDDNYPDDHGHGNVANYVARVDDKYDDNSKDDADHDVMMTMLLTRWRQSSRLGFSIK